MFFALSRVFLGLLPRSQPPAFSPALQSPAETMETRKPKFDFNAIELEQLGSPLPVVTSLIKTCGFMLCRGIERLPHRKGCPLPLHSSKPFQAPLFLLALG